MTHTRHAWFSLARFASYSELNHDLYFHTHTHIRLTALCPGMPGWAGTRKVKPIWILLKQETMSGSGISWTICKSALCSIQIDTPAPHHSVFYRPDALPAAQPTASKHSVAKSCITVSFIYSLRIAIFLNTDISQGSVATRVGCGEVFKYDFVKNFLLSLTAEEFSKSVNIWWSYGQELVSCFLDSQFMSTMYTTVSV